VRHPLQDIGNLSRQAGVMSRGRWLDAQVIKRELRKLAATAKQ
jgi:hypothetical protein